MTDGDEVCDIRLLDDWEKSVLDEIDWVASGELVGRVLGETVPALENEGDGVADAAAEIVIILAEGDAVIITLSEIVTVDETVALADSDSGLLADTEPLPIADVVDVTEILLESVVMGVDVDIKDMDERGEREDSPDCDTVVEIALLCDASAVDDAESLAEELRDLILDAVTLGEVDKVIAATDIVADIEGDPEVSSDALRWLDTDCVGDWVSITVWLICEVVEIDTEADPEIDAEYEGSAEEVMETVSELDTEGEWVETTLTEEELVRDTSKELLCKAEDVNKVDSETSALDETLEHWETVWVSVSVGESDGNGVGELDSSDVLETDTDPLGITVDDCVAENDCTVETDIVPEVSVDGEIDPDGEEVEDSVDGTVSVGEESEEILGVEGAE